MKDESDPAHALVPAPVDTPVHPMSNMSDPGATPQPAHLALSAADPPPLAGLDEAVMPPPSPDGAPGAMVRLVVCSYI